jgi:hypothetical protein
MGLLYQLLMTEEYGALVEYELAAETDVFMGKKRTLS